MEDGNSRDTTYIDQLRDACKIRWDELNEMGRNEIPVFSYLGLRFVT